MSRRERLAQSQLEILDDIVDLLYPLFDPRVVAE